MGPDEATDAREEASRSEALPAAGSGEVSGGGLAAQAGGATVAWTGRVLDDAEETPISGARVVLSLGEHAEVVSPESCRQKLAEVAEKLAKTYR